MPRRNTAQKKARFLQAIERDRNVTEAADYATVSRTTPYTWETEDPAFEEAWARVRDIRLRQLTDTATDVALEGDVTMLKFLISRLDHEAEKGQTATIGEIAILPVWERTDDDQKPPQFISLERPD